ncbi:CPBP family intramembrane glutamic endopeptidase [Candidatus Lokiarchaeum ossiferum]|uniref:CPBP family intramembrane glutamic endopeptidase n=1 Tax=Candidatus Lokiarchaeum ossiferum TaxID=2951803 RepID=UPI00352C8549
MMNTIDVELKQSETNDINNPIKGKKLDSKMNVWSFFLITYLISWILWLPGILRTFVLPDISRGLVEGLAMLSTIVPSCVGLAFIFKENGKEGLVQVLKKSFDFKHYKWLLPSLLIYLALIVISHLINLIRKVPFPVGYIWQEWWMIIPLYILMLIIGGSIGEEFGWRGYAIPELQKQFNAYTSALIVGFLWAFWHIPTFFIDGANQRDEGLPFIPYVITLVCFTIIMVWQINISKSSLVPAFTLHTLINITNEFFPILNTDTGDYSAWIIIDVLLILCCILIPLFYRVDNFQKRKKSQSDGPLSVSKELQ